VSGSHRGRGCCCCHARCADTSVAVAFTLSLTRTASKQTGVPQSKHVKPVSMAKSLAEPLPLLLGSGKTHGLGAVDPGPATGAMTRIGGDARGVAEPVTLAVVDAGAEFQKTARCSRAWPQIHCAQKDASITTTTLALVNDQSKAHTQSPTPSSTGTSETGSESVGSISLDPHKS
jgi:hypothetical protein